MCIQDMRYYDVDPPSKKNLNLMEKRSKKICPNCSRHIIEPDTNFCPSCGTQVSHIREMDDIHPDSVDRQGRQHFMDTLPSAGFWIRSGAFWMDELIILLLAMFFGSLAYSTALGRQLFPNLEKINLFIILLFILYHGIFLGKFKTTPGKKFFGLTVIPSDVSERFGYSESFLRTFGYYISGLCLGIGFLWIAFDKQKQGWHDKIARTKVIKKATIPLFKRLTILALLTLLVAMMIALQFNLTWVYRSMFQPSRKPWLTRGKEIVSVLVTQKELRDGIFKEIMTRAGPHTIKLPQSARDGEIFKVNRSEEEGGIFYIRIIIVERI